MRTCSVAILCGVTLWICLAASRAGAAELLPAERPLQEVIDHYVHARLKAEAISPAPLADDANILRRTMLDLVGRPPTRYELDQYIADSSPDKRERMVDSLLASPAYVEHQVTEFNWMLMGSAGGDIRGYLEEALQDNRAWDQVFRELVLADQSGQEKAREFLLRRLSDTDQLTTDVSVLFFGVNVSCAQCHDHPYVGDWTQDRFYGMKSFFNRTFENGGFLGEREYGLVSFQNVYGDKEEAELMFISGTVIEEPASEEPSDEEQKKEKKLLEELKKKKEPPPSPAFSRRAQLVDVALREEERHYFARSLVNRMWYRLLGHGLVMPIDQMHDENPASHPELMDWLERDTISHGYDVKRLLRGIVLSDTYARSSQWSSESLPDASLFAFAQLRPLSPEQYAATLKLASQNQNQYDASEKPEDVEKRLAGLNGSARGLVSKFERPGPNFQVSVTESLQFSNDSSFERDLLRDSGDTVVGQLKEVADPAAAAELAIRSVLGREPADEEVRWIADYLSARRDRSTEACQQVVWSLLTSSELRFNY